MLGHCLILIINEAISPVQKPFYLVSSLGKPIRKYLGNFFLPLIIEYPSKISNCFAFFQSVHKRIIFYRSRFDHLILIIHIEDSDSHVPIFFFFRSFPRADRTRDWSPIATKWVSERFNKILYFCIYDVRRRLNPSLKSIA